MAVVAEAAWLDELGRELSAQEESPQRAVFVIAGAPGLLSPTSVAPATTPSPVRRPWKSPCEIVVTYPLPGLIRAYGGYVQVEVMAPTNQAQTLTFTYNGQQYQHSLPALPAAVPSSPVRWSVIQAMSLGSAPALHVSVHILGQYQQGGFPLPQEWVDGHFYSIDNRGSTWRWYIENDKLVLRSPSSGAEPADGTSIDDRAEALIIPRYS